VPDASAEGAFVACDADAAERVRFVMAAFGATPVDVAVTVGGEVRRAEAHVADGAGLIQDAAAGDWGDERRRLLAEIVAEVALHLGERPPEHLAGLLHGIGFRALARVRGRELSTPAQIRSSRAAADVEVVDRRIGYAGYFAVEEIRVRHRRFGGGLSDEQDRAVLTSGDAVTVLPFDARRGSVLLIEQFRAGALVRGDRNPWCLEVIAGRCDKLETTEATARREAREEAGLELGRLEPVASYYSTPGVASEFITAYVGEADLGRAGGLFGLDVEGEDIRALVVPLDEAVVAVARGEINNAPLLVSVMWLDRHRARLQEAWGAANAARAGG
jgi:nudix-type nucleoside diphosphatase (YffH/AdpP family)